MGTVKLPVLARLPVVGEALAIGDEFAPYLWQVHQNLLAQKKPAMMAIKVLGEHFLHVGEPDAIAAIFGNVELWQRPPKIYDNIREVMDGVLGIAAADGDEYWQQRPHIASSFAGRLMGRYAHVIHEVAMQLLIEELEQAAPWAPVDVHDLFHRVNAMALTRCMFNVAGEHRPLSDEEMTVITASADTVYLYAFKAGMTPSWLQFTNRGMSAKYKAEVAKVLPLLTKAVDKYYNYIQENNLTEGWDFISTLIIEGVINPKKEEERITIQFVRANIFILVIAGIDTTLSLEKSLIWALGDESEWSKSVLEELRASDEVITLNGMATLPLTSMYIDEVLRLYPPVSVIVRQNMLPTELVGFAVPRGYISMSSQHVMHQDPRFWNHPETFNPERFQNGEPFNPNAYFPFWQGTHTCTGQKFSKMSAMNSMRVLASHFDWFRGKVASYHGTFGATFQSRFDVYFTRRA